MDQPIMRADDPSKAIIAMERAALDRWGKGDPSGFLEISAPDVVYFDPSLERRIDGREALARYYEALRGKVATSRYELINPRVQHVGDMAVLTFNYVSYGGTENAPAGTAQRCTAAPVTAGRSSRRTGPTPRP